MADIIDQLQGMSDEELMSKFGFQKQLSKAKSGIAELAKLEGDAREAAARRVNDMLNPTVYIGDLNWIAEDAKREACNDACAEMADASPMSLAKLAGKMPSDDDGDE